ncbi:PC4 domain-containing protein [Trichonephila clavipes]|nr:PC4 domain-containing protein [Trichonephila clavipes]
MEIVLIVTSSMGVNPIFQVTIGFMVLPAGQGQVPHPSIVPECFTINQLWNDRCTWPWGHCLLSELREWTVRSAGCKCLPFLLVKSAREVPAFRFFPEKDKEEVSSVFTCNVKLTMKHATPLAFTHPRAKRVCFDKDNGKASSFKPDAVPENHFHLGSHNYAVVSDFADVARIHLRRYKLDATGSLLPTKDGITVTPSVWLAPS